MIRRVAYSGFQALDRFLLELSPNVTTIVGPTDVGKSACFRGLWWAMTNQPDGLDFLGDWGNAKRCRVRVDIGGHTLVRSRSSRHNSFNLDGGDLKSFGRSGVPDPVRTLVNVSEWNYQNQLEPPFWFTLSAPQIARNLNEIVNLSEIDAVMASAGQLVRKWKAKKEESRERLTAARSRRTEFGWAKPARDAVNRYAERYRRRGQIAARSRSLAEAVTALAEAGRTVKTASLAHIRAAALAERVRRRADRIGRQRSIENTLDEIAVARKRATLSVPSLERIISASERRNRMRSMRRSIESLHFGITNLEYEVDEWQQKIERTADLLSRLRCCATCGQLMVPPSASPTATSTPASVYPWDAGRRRTNGSSSRPIT